MDSSRPSSWRGHADERGRSQVAGERAKKVTSGVGSWTTIDSFRAGFAPLCSRSAEGAIAARATAARAGPRRAGASFVLRGGDTVRPRRGGPITPITSARTAPAAQRA